MDIRNMPDIEVFVDDSDNPKSTSSNRSTRRRARSRSKSRVSNGQSVNYRDNNSNNQINNAGLISNVMNFKNNCGQIVAQLESNLTYARNGFHLTKSDNPVQLSFTIMYNRDDLWNQATVWAEQFLQMGNIRYVHLLGRDERKWRDQLIQMYIFSFSKSLILAGDYQIVREQFNDSHMFTGHRILYEIIRTRKFSFEYEPGVFVHINLDTTKFQLDSIKQSLLTDFPFLKTCLTQDSGIGLNFTSSKFENLFSSIKNHALYPQKVAISSLTEEDPYVISQFKADSLPLGNSFLKSDNSGFYYLTSSLQNVTDKSISLQRACFITSVDSNTISKYNFIEYNRKTIFAKHDASAVTGIDIKYEPNAPYDPDRVKIPVGYYGNPDSSPGQTKDTEGIPVKVPISETDKIKEILTENEETGVAGQSDSKETQIDFNATYELFKRLNLRVKGVLSQSTNILPFDLSSKVDIVRQISSVTFIQLMSEVLKNGARFYMNNYEFTDSGIKLIDGSVSIRFDDSVQGALIPIKDVFDILTAAWFSKNAGKSLDLENFQSWLNKKSTTNIRYEVNKKYIITVYGDLHLSGTERVPPRNVDKGKF